MSDTTLDKALVPQRLPIYAPVLASSAAPENAEYAKLTVVADGSAKRQIDSSPRGGVCGLPFMALGFPIILNAGQSMEPNSHLLI